MSIVICQMCKEETDELLSVWDSCCGTVDVCKKCSDDLDRAAAAEIESERRAEAYNEHVLAHGHWQPDPDDAREYWLAGLEEEEQARREEQKGNQHD